MKAFKTDSLRLVVYVHQWSTEVGTVMTNHLQMVQFHKIQDYESCKKAKVTKGVTFSKYLLAARSSIITYTQTTITTNCKSL